KALLGWQGTTLLGYVLRQLRIARVEHVVVVLGLAHEQISRSVADLAGAQVTLNLHEASGRSGSIRIGASAVPDGVSRVLVQSVDHACRAAVLAAPYTPEGRGAGPRLQGPPRPPGWCRGARAT